MLVIGAGLAGSEAAWQLARAGIPVDLIEMRPVTMTPAHRTGNFAELVCSNSLRSGVETNAVGLLKREMEALDSIVMRAAHAAAVPAGSALAVDRQVFAETVTEALASHPLIRVRRDEVTELPEGPAIVATGPLTSPPLHAALESLLGEGALAFYDAVAPIVTADSLDRTKLFAGSRYAKGGGDDYLNAPLTRGEYERFVDELLAAEKVPFRAFESEAIHYFEGCLPVEVMAERGRDTLRYGPMKPVGLVDPRTGTRPWAVIQLRQDDLAAEQWNLVGFQTKLTKPEQKRVFRMIPGLEHARFVRYGMIHRNTFINAPAHLDPLLRLRLRPDLRLAGQITGVEGYVESAAIGLLAGRMAAMELTGRAVEPPPPATAMGGLIRHLTARRAGRFEPANISWGLIRCPLELSSIRDKRERRRQQGAAALDLIRRWAAGEHV